MRFGRVEGEMTDKGLRFGGGEGMRTDKELRFRGVEQMVSDKGPSFRGRLDFGRVGRLTRCILKGHCSSQFEELINPDLAKPE